jgi:YfiH family protein
MLKETSKGLFQSDLLLSRTRVIHGYSTKHFGDMRKSKNRRNFLRVLHLENRHLVYGTQIHGNVVSRVNDITQNMLVSRTDGLLYIHNQKYPSPVLSVFTADCVPILFVDKTSKMIGIVHAGWRGTLAGISREMIRCAGQCGYDPKDLSVSIGPSIGACCYNIDKYRAQLFSESFKDTCGIVMFRNNRWYVDLKKANYTQLVDEGVSGKNIECTSICTNCQRSDFFSFRREKGTSSGNCMSCIAIT